jgi:hypothetical protein
MNYKVLPFIFKMIQVNLQDFLLYLFILVLISIYFSILFKTYIEFYFLIKLSIYDIIKRSS